MAGRLVFILLIYGSGARALDLDSAILQSLRSSGTVKGQQLSTDIAANDRWRRFIFHEPQFSYSNVDSGNQESWGLSLATPFPGKAFAAMELDRVKAEGERFELSAKRQDVAKLIADAYLECAGDRALTEIQKTSLRDLMTLERSFQAMYESGHASQAERIGAELQARQTRTEVSELIAKTEVACKRWRALLDIHDASVYPDGMPDDLKSATLNELGSKPAADLRASTSLKLADANRDFRWWAQAPDLNWTYSRNHYLYLPGSPTGREWTTTYGVAINIPIFFLFDEKVEASRARAQSMIDRRTAEVDMASAAADQEAAVRDFQRAKKRIAELRSKDLALADALMQSTLAAYKIGKLGFAELMMARKTLADLRSQEVQLQTTAIQARLKCLGSCEAAVQGEDL